MHKSGGRQPAVARVTHLQRRAFLSERDARVALARLAYASRSGSRERMPLLMCVSDWRVRYVCHGWPTPTAPGARRGSAKNGDIRGAKTHMHKSGGRQPAVGVGNTIAQTPARLFCRPPTVYVRIAVAFTVIVTTGGLRPPLFVIAMRTSAGIKNDFCAAQTHMHKSGGRQPAVVRVTHLQRRAFLSERETRVALARLAYASRSWCTTLRSIGK
jgi:hypothetical protein